jgi:hypothetical protein
MNLRVLENVGNFLTRRKTIIFSRRRALQYGINRICSICPVETILLWNNECSGTVFVEGAYVKW